MFCMLLHDFTCIFSHSTHLRHVALAQLAAADASVGCETVFCILLHGITCIFLHATHLRWVAFAQLVAVALLVRGDKR